MISGRLRRIDVVEGDLGFIEVLSDGKRRYLQGRLRVGDVDVELKVTPRVDQSRPSIQQDLGKLVNLVDKLGIKSRVESVSRNSFHRRKLFVCPSGDYKSTRLTDVLIHMVRVHKALLTAKRR